MLQHILLPLDGSDVAEKAIPYAKQITEPGGRITLLSVVDIPETVTMMYAPGGVVGVDNHGVIEDKLIPDASQYLDGIAARLRNLGFVVDYDVVVDDPALAIVDTAERLSVDAVVMSTHGRTGFSKFLFGSVAQKTLGSVNCPVFIVPARDKPGRTSNGSQN